MKMIDSHIHLDHYQDEDIDLILAESADIDYLLSVSFDLESCKRNLQLAKRFPKVKPAFGYHPEQPLPRKEYINTLLDWMLQHQEEMIAIGEVGLPYYLRQEQQISSYEYSCYIELLETFFGIAKTLGKPIVLHSVYDDAPLVCDLLEKYNIQKAHFHWFKGEQKTIERMTKNGYFISITPDVLYEEEIQSLVKFYPLLQIMVETDGPWAFEGPFINKMTHPKMMEETIFTISKIKGLSGETVADCLLRNTKRFYNLK